MKITKISLFLLTSLLLISPCFAKNPPMPTTAPGSQVVLDWDQFIKLWEKANTPPKPTPPDPAPVDFIVSRAQYIGEFHPTATEMTAIFDLNVLNDDKWVRIPFLPSSLGLKNVTMDGKPVAVHQDDGFHSLVLKGAKQHKLKAVFSVLSPGIDDHPQIKFPIQETAMTLLTMTFPKPNLKVSVKPAQVLTSKTIDKKTTVHAILPPTKSIQLNWRKKPPVGQKIPAKLYSQMSQLISVYDASIKLNSQYNYSILHSGVKSFKLNVPKEINVLGVKGKFVQNWKINDRILTVYLSRKVKGNQFITVNSEYPMNENEIKEISYIQSMGVEREEGFFGIEAKSNVEVSINDSKGLRQVDVKELNANVWAMATSPLLYGFIQNGKSVSLSMGIKRHENISVLNSTIDSVNAVTVLTKDGQWITRTSFNVRNHLKQFITLELPSEANIWSAFVSGKPVKPSRNADGNILIPLEKSTQHNNNASFPVEIIYHKKGNKLSWLGNKDVALPKVDLPISQMMWSVYVPEEYRFVHFGGNMDNERVASGLMPVIRSAKKEKRFDAEFKSISKMDYIGSREKVIAKGGFGFKPSPPVVRDQAEMEIDTVGGAMSNHTLPIAFKIPQVGRVYRFGKIMVTDTQPVVSMKYTRHEFYSTLKFVLAGYLFFLLFPRVMPWIKTFSKRGKSFFGKRKQIAVS